MTKHAFTVVRTGRVKTRSGPTGALESMAGKLLGKAVKSHFEPKADKPVFHYLFQVQSVKVEPVHDSVFEVPKGFVERPLPKMGDS